MLIFMDRNFLDFIFTGNSSSFSEKMEKLLIIDDDESLKETLQLALSDAGYFVFAASNAENGLEQGIIRLR